MTLNLWSDDVCPIQHTYENRNLRRVPLDKSEGVVKRHFLLAMLGSTASPPEWLRTEALKLSP
jgi:hypothetical protein